MALPRLRHELRHQVRRDGEADAVRPARPGQDRGVDADQLPVHIDQRTAGIARIDRCVGLDEVTPAVARRHARARQPRHDTAGHGLADAERVTDRQHQFAHLDPVAVAQVQGRHIIGPDQFQDRQVAVFVRQHHRGIEFATVVQHHPDFGRIAHHVVVRHDVTVIRQDHPRSQRILHLRPDLSEIAEQAPEKGIALKRALPGLHDPLGIDVHHRRRGLLDQRREAQLNFHPALRHPGFGGQRRGKDQKKNGENAEHRACPRLTCP